MDRPRLVRAVGLPDDSVNNVGAWRAVWAGAWSFALVLLLPLLAHARYSPPMDAFEPHIRLRAAWAVRLYTNRLLAVSPRDRAKCAWVGRHRLVVCGSRVGLVVALDPDFGGVVWKMRARGAVFGRPCVSGGGVAVTSSDGCLYMLDAATGRRKAEFCPGAGAIHSSPLCGDGLVYFVTVQDRLFAVKAQSLEPAFSYTREQPEGLVGQGSSPGALKGGRLFAGFSDGTLVALDAREGRVEWTAKVARSKGMAELRDVEWVTVLPDGRVYAALVREGPVVLDAGSGKVTFRGSFLGPGLPVFVDDKLIFTTSLGEVVALNRDTLETVYVRQLPSCAYDPVVVFRWLVVGTDDALFVIDPKDGWPVHGIHFVSGVRSAPLAVKNRLFFVTGQGFVDSVDLLGL